jgi:hypothetical protein
MWPSRLEVEIWVWEREGVCECGWAGFERSQVNISPEEWPHRRTVWSADNARAVMGPLSAAMLIQP